MIAILLAVVAAFMGAAGLGGVLTGYLLAKTYWPERIVLAAGATLAFMPGMWSNMMAPLVIITVVIEQFLRIRLQRRLKPGSDNSLVESDSNMS